MRKTILSIVLAVAVSPSYAWDGFGHMEVAYIAYQQMTPAARARSKAVL